jgi:hypothetical protein
VEGYRRLHERLDAHEDLVAAGMQAAREEADMRADQIERKIDRFIWITVGATLAGFGAGWAIGGAGPIP